MSKRYRLPLLILPIILVASLLIAPASTVAQQRDTTVVQAFTFSDTTSKRAWGHIYEYEGMVSFPEVGGRYEKIIMQYTLKCDAATTADNLPCGEWDYSTFTRVWDDSTTFWEIGRFITPYGIGLSLGPDGFMWEFDVTDYAPILVGDLMVTAGNNQELLDLKFLFISGIPTRDPISVTRLWTPGNKNYLKVTQDSILGPIDVELDPNAKEYRINTRPQGGNFNGGPDTDNCSEFCNREHSLMIDGAKRFAWNVWNECGENPVFPQGGTWIYDRAGWCPGAIVTTQQHELTEWVTPGETVTIDYDIENPAGRTPYGHWVFWADLVAYGPANFSVDAALERIVTPSSADIYSRMNPSCLGPMIEVSGRGTTDITSITFSYGFAGGDRIKYDWTGIISYLGTEQITLPPLPLDDVSTGEGRFEVEIVSVNGDADEYSPNDFAWSMAQRPERLPSDIQLSLRTNNLAAISSSNYVMTLYDAEGNRVFTKNDFGVNETSKHPLSLPDGCYTLELVNPEGLGLDFWAIRDQLGTGSLEILNESGTVVERFDPDFGNRILYAFTVPAPQAEYDQASVDFGASRVGESTRRQLRITSANSIGISVRRIVFFNGASIFSIDKITPEIEGNSVFIQRGDTMVVDMSFTPKDERDYTGHILVTSDDVRGVTRVNVTGRGDNSASVREVASTLNHSIETSLNGDQSLLRWELVGQDKASSQVESISIVNSAGEVVHTSSYHDVPGRREGTLSTLDLPSGAYFVRLETDRGIGESRFHIAR